MSAAARSSRKAAAPDASTSAMVTPSAPGAPSVGSHLLPGPEQDVAADDLVVQGMEAALRLLLGTAVEHALQRTGWVQAVGLRGGPSPHAGTHRIPPPARCIDEAGVLPITGGCVVRPARAVLRPPPTPWRPPATSRWLPVIGRRCFPNAAGSGPPRVSPVPTTPFWHSTPPTPEGSLAPAPGSQVPSMAFAPRNTGSAPSWSACAGIPDDAAGFA